MSPELTESLESICKQQKIPYRKMISGPAHDAAAMGQIMPAALIFVPSKNGLSHCPQEDTAAEDLVTGASILEASVRLAAGCRL